MQRSYARHQLWVVAQLIKARDRPNEGSLRAAATDPMDLDFNPFALALDGDHDPLHQLPDDGLPIGRTRCRRVPQRRNVAGEPADCLALGGAERDGLLGHKARMLGLQLGCGGERLLPLLL